MSYSRHNEQEAELALLDNDSLSIPASDDLESNRKNEDTTNTTNTTVELEYQTPMTVKFIWLGSYFLFSMLLTLYNKLLLGSVRMTLNMRMSVKY
ncbi:Drug/metabolite transporter [Penicillium freii]|nr:Drug/metabolite transporter [Penicillium freii]